jgi:YkoY family integral membrane protein
MSFGFQEFLPQDLFDVQEQWPVLASLAMIEILLSADNLIEVSTIAAHLPIHQRLTVLRLGVIGAYVARAIVLILAAPYIAQYPFIRFVGALYLVYLSTAHFTQNRDRDLKGAKEHWSFSKTLFAVLGVDLVLSIDNVVAAVSLSKTPWVVWSSVIFGFVFIGLLGRFTTKLLKRSKALLESVYALMGCLGVLLLIEVITHTTNLTHLQDEERFWGLVFIVAATIIYDGSPLVQRLLGPALKIFVQPVLRAIHWPLSIAFSPIRKLIEFAAK